MGVRFGRDGRPRRVTLGKLGAMKAVEALAAALAFLGRRKTGGANRCHAILRTMFGCAIAWGHQPETTWIPYNGVVRYRHPPPGPTLGRGVGVTVWP